MNDARQRDRGRGNDGKETKKVVETENDKKNRNGERGRERERGK